TGDDGRDRNAGRDDRAGLVRSIGEGEGHAPHAPVDVAPSTLHAVEDPERVVGVEAGGARVTWTGTGADDALAVQGGAQPIVAHVVLDDVGDRGVEQGVDRLAVVAEPRLDLVARRRGAEPGVALWPLIAQRPT